MTIKELQGLLDEVFSLDTPPKKIKITRRVAAIINEVSKPVFKEMSMDEYVNTYSGTVGQFIGIPMEIDDTMENEYYELVYEEN